MNSKSQDICEYLFQLDINEKSWIIRSAQGNLVEMRILLDLDSTLVEKRVS